MLSEKMKEQLMDMGLSKQQANSLTAEVVVDSFMNADEKTLLVEAQRQVQEMSDIVKDLRCESLRLVEKIDTAAGFLVDIAQAQEEHGILTDDKAKNAVALYAALLKMNERAGVRGMDSVESAGYITYAYLGGQAKREISYAPKDEIDTVFKGMKVSKTRV